MTHNNFPQIDGLAQFSSLSSLCIIAQDVSEIKGLYDLPIEELWICESKVSQIKGLERCPRLKRLYLYGNYINKIEGLGNVSQLEVLWLSDNRIPHIENLSHLKKLRELKLANNEIAEIGNSLKENTSLQDLNLAGNKLSCFIDILNLASLPRLTTLTLGSPEFATNPLCHLSNYQTHVIHNLRTLLTLDAVEITDESRKMVAATFFKKKMYYNMRNQTVKRNANFLRELLSEFFHFMDVESLSLQSRLSQLCRRIDLQYEAYCRKNKMELSSGGNIRFELVEREDRAFSLCSTLFRQALSLNEPDHTAVQCNGCINTFNTGEAVQSSNQTKFAVLACSVKGGQQSNFFIEYTLVEMEENKTPIESFVANLVLSPKFVDPNMPLHVQQQLVPFKRQNMQQDYRPQHMLTTSMSENLQLGASVDEPSLNIMTWWSLTSLTEASHLLFQPTMESITILELNCANIHDLSWLPTHLKGNSIEDVSPLAKFPSLQEIYLDNNLIESLDVLAELPHLKKIDAAHNRISNIRNLGNFKTLMELYLSGNPIFCGKDYRFFVIFHLGKLKILDGAAITNADQLLSQELFLGRLTIELLGEQLGTHSHNGFSGISDLDIANCKIRHLDCFSDGLFPNLRKLNVDNNLLTSLDALLCLKNLESLSANNNRIEQVFSGSARETSDVIKSRVFAKLYEVYMGGNQICKFSDLCLTAFPSLRILHIPGNRLPKIEGIGHMEALTQIVADRNQIKCLEPNVFFGCPRLKDLHLRENRVKHLGQFFGIISLRTLHLNSNRISDMGELQKFDLPNLLEISMSGNPVTRRSAYRRLLILHIPSLLIIDTKEIDVDEREKSQTYESDLQKIADQGEDQSVKSTGNLSLNSKTPLRVSPVVFDAFSLP
ncbi:L domain-like protein [Gonapodya prolifera JEL478]|uniref:L domain-like protein n=1 Tax=Gonapodya prolifera (strain JEL478) TaxID=1344416 RepID=A0A139AU95_GONPJ|nr:L domain-like protein [Gonapodya prolifera JEL478]|eukprot:KXS20065.1 L domain-like protein [Gonapodya prolifera JEL478]